MFVVVFVAFLDVIDIVLFFEISLVILTNMTSYLVSLTHREWDREREFWFIFAHGDKLSWFGGDKYKVKILFYLNDLFYILLKSTLKILYKK